MTNKLPFINPEQLRHLEKEEINFPSKCILDFFEAFTLRSCYKNLWELLLGFLSSDLIEGKNSEQMSYMLDFYQKLEALLEAAYLTQAEKTK